MAYIQHRGERKYKITVCNGYKPNGQKRMQARTVDVPKEVPKRSIRQYVMAEAERLEKRFRTGIDQSENTRFEDYANRWLTRMERRYKASTLEGYRRMLESVYPNIGGLPLCKIRPISFVVSVMTNIAAYIGRKWIDKQSHDKIKGRCTAIQRPFWCR